MKKVMMTLMAVVFAIHKPYLYSPFEYGNSLVGLAKGFPALCQKNNKSIWHAPFCRLLVCEFTLLHIIFNSS